MENRWSDLTLGSKVNDFIGRLKSQIPNPKSSLHVEQKGVCKHGFPPIFDLKFGDVDFVLINPTIWQSIKRGIRSLHTSHRFPIVISTTKHQKDLLPPALHRGDQLDWTGFLPHAM